jgi:phenylacetate-CoA ligase
VLTRDAVRENIYFDLLADNSNKRKLLKVVTSGPPGEPLPLFVDRLQLDVRWANRVRAAEWAGYRLGDAHVAVARSALGLPLRARLDALLSRGKIVGADALDERSLRALAGHLRSRRPALLAADADALAILGHFLAARDVPGRGAGAVASGGQELPPAARQLVEERLGAPLFDTYAAGGLDAIAHECEAHAGYHVNAESYLVEILRDGRPAAEGELGDVVVTDLNSRSVPLLRYRVGDVAAATARRCPCGRGLPLLARVVGRPPAAVLASGGRHVPAGVFADLFDRYDYAVRRYQVVQERAGALDVRVVRKSRFTAETGRAIVAALGRILGPEVAVQLAFVDAIPAEADGSVPVCVCRIPLPLLPEASPAPHAVARQHAAR